MRIPLSSLPGVVMIGGRFRGVKLARHLDKEGFQVVLIDRHNYRRHSRDLRLTIRPFRRPPNTSQPKLSLKWISNT